MASQEKKLSMSEDRLKNGWNPPNEFWPKMKYILASIGPVALTAGLCMGPGSINATLQLGAYGGYSQFYLMVVIALLGGLAAYAANYIMVGTHEPGEQALSILQIFKREMPKPIALFIGACVWMPFWFILLTMSNLLGATVNALFPAVPSSVAVIIAGPIIALIFTQNMSGIRKLFAGAITVLTIMFIFNGIFARPDMAKTVAGLIPSMPATPEGKIAWSGVIGGAIVGGALFCNPYGNLRSGICETKHLKLIKSDVTVSYILVFLFSSGVFLSGAAVLNPLGEKITSVLQAAAVFEPIAGSGAKYVLLIGYLFAVIQTIGSIANLNTFISCDMFGVECNYQKHPKQKLIVVAHCLLISFGMVFKQFAPVQLVVYAMAISNIFGPAICIGLLYVLFKKGAMKISSPIWMKVVIAIVLCLNLMAAYLTIVKLVG